MERFSIGQSRSGKVILTTSDFNELHAPEDLFDAMTILMALALREQRRGVNVDMAKQLAKRANDLKIALETSKQMSIQKAAIGARVSTDLLRHGLSLLLPEFKD